MERVVPFEQVNAPAPVPDEALRIWQTFLVDERLRYGDHTRVNVYGILRCVTKRLVRLIEWSLRVQRDEGVQRQSGC